MARTDWGLMYVRVDKLVSSFFERTEQKLLLTCTNICTSLYNK